MVMIMKNIHLIEQFMKENDIKYNEPFIVRWWNTKEGIVRFEKYFDNVILFRESCFGKENPWTDDDGRIFNDERFMYDILFSPGVKILKKPCEPYDGSKYWYVTQDGEVYSSSYNKIDVLDKAMFLIGNCFKNEKEAKDNREKIMQILNSRKPLLKELKNNKGNFIGVKMENTSTNNMYEHVKSIKNGCDKYRKENGGSCRGCIFNKLVYKDGDYDDFEWTDENDKNDDNLTFCELFFDIGPLNWDLEEFSNKINEDKKNK